MGRSKKTPKRLDFLQYDLFCCFSSSSCTGVLHYSGVASIPTNLSAYPAPLLATNDQLLSFAVNNPFQTLLPIDQMPSRVPDREIFLYNYQDYTPDGLKGIKWYTNNGTMGKYRLSNLTRPLLDDLYNGIEDYLPVDVVYSIGQSQLIDIVFQNTVATNGVCESHPFHLHGHKFWVHSSGTGTYNSSANVAPFSATPVLRDSVTLHATAYSHLAPNRNASNHLKPCGWLKIRMIADNPGLWLLHCHIGSHLFMGMAVLLKEDIEHLSMYSLSQN